MNKYYTGIGSRETPNDILELLRFIGKYLAGNGYILRSGGAKGADQAFELGCVENNGNKEIYLPWANFENNPSKLYNISEEAFNLAAKFHPRWESQTQGTKKLLARDGYQVLGLDLDTKSEFILCFTHNGNTSGGTGQAIRIAHHYNIPVFNFGKYSDIESCKYELKIFLRGFNLN